MKGNVTGESSDSRPHTVREWFLAVVHAPSRWDVALACIPLAISFGVLLGGTRLPMWTGVTTGLALALLATGYVIATDAPS